MEPPMLSRYLRSIESILLPEKPIEPLLASGPFFWRTLEALWLCELQSFEAIQTFTATLHQREHTWQQLKFYEEGISTTEFEVPKEAELYNIAL